MVAMGAPEALGGASPLGRRPGFGGAGFGSGKKRFLSLFSFFMNFSGINFSGVFLGLKSGKFTS